MAKRFAIRVIFGNDSYYAGPGADGCVSNSPGLVLEWTYRNRDEAEKIFKRINGVWSDATYEIVYIDVTEKLQARRRQLFAAIELIDSELKEPIM